MPYVTLVLWTIHEWLSGTEASYRSAVKSFFIWLCCQPRKNNRGTHLAAICESFVACHPWLGWLLFLMSAILSQGYPLPRDDRMEKWPHDPANSCGASGDYSTLYWTLNIIWRSQFPFLIYSRLRFWSTFLLVSHLGLMSTFSENLYTYLSHQMSS